VLLTYLDFPILIAGVFDWWNFEVTRVKYLGGEIVLGYITYLSVEEIMSAKVFFP
jgi:hypothetical protein